ncbi:amino-acid N-acetyltransferase [Burkholderiales bacterium]|nr:amino-acid N-acetyltransferase [Burkholderiales bacterium]
MRSVEIELSGEWDAEFDAFLSERIYEFNSHATGLFDGRAIVGRIGDASGRTIAGVTGHTWGGTCQVTYLWVQESHRRRGLGRALLGAVEVEARRRDCTQVVLATHTFQAAGFYETLGYRQRAAIPDYPIGHAQLLYVKKLVASGAA